MSVFSYSPDTLDTPVMGLVVLQSDETIEQDFRQMLPAAVRFHVSRIASAPDVSRETLAQMETHLPAAAGLFPQSLRFDAIGYGCTSGTAQIGADRIAELIAASTSVAMVTEPVSALIAACRHLKISRLGFLSPYVMEVSDHLREVLRKSDVQTPVFGTFAEGREEQVVRISAASVIEAGKALMAGAGADALFLSCTNLRTMTVIDPLEEALGLPVLSSNQVLAWHMAQLAGVAGGLHGPGRLLKGA